jgi:hypothetical protein
MCLEMDSDTKLDMVVLLDRPRPGGGPFDIDHFFDNTTRRIVKKSRRS